MDFLDLVKDRYSVRDFLDREVEQEKIDKILTAGNVAPTACNRQPQRIYIIKSKESIDKIRNITRMVFNAPIVFLVCADIEEAWHNPFDKNYNSSEMDASIVTTHMMLEAWNLGVSSVWIKWFNHDLVSREFNLPQNVKPICLLPLGYKKDTYFPTSLHNEKKDLKEIVKYL